MWTTALVALALAHAGHGFVMSGLNVPPAPEYGATVTLETNYRLGRGEYIRKMKWYKDDVVFMSYAERPKKFLNWSPLPGVNIDEAASTPSAVVLTDVGDETSGQYTLEVQVYGPGGNVANIVNGQYMSVGGADTLGTRFGGNAGAFNPGTFFQGFGPGFPFNNFQGTFQSSSSTGDLGPDSLGTRTSFQSSSSSAGGAVPDTLGTRTNFQSASAGGNTAFQSSGPEGSFQSAGTSFQGTDANGNFFQSSVSSGPGSAQSVQTAFTGSGVGPLGVRSSFQSASSTGDVGPGPALAVQSAVAQAEAQVQQAVNQINQLQAALANLG
ncbi:hypothetical protein FJT64_018296 [Amphibalanus amphitrite]|uniref:Uncharacterized protein n=2 Tax=Amphibalanus amphitrite TaxID=1232801 RepID=A0A6A4WLG1_AMPAM|nr:GPI-anchored hemophore cfmA-like isoform X1 [Amphibalanus amphitrite]KAF0306963.1 hypothetical protein FJT64_021616 [Amphibalanus amphitrite]KAF0310815.1 hypothetical protein FJT64_018296 [Amphibalanus amphitrite]